MPTPIHVTNANETEENLTHGPRRQLEQRHVQMIAVAGTVGTALFLGSGQALSGGGPLGALLAYAFVGSVAYASLCSVGEMTSLAPVAGSFAHYAHRWVDGATGFAVGWIYFFTNAVTIPAEIAGAELLISYWNVNPRPYVVLILGVTCLVNIFGVRYFGEGVFSPQLLRDNLNYDSVEFWFSIVKLTMIAILILISIVIDLGGAPDHRRLGFQYWKNPGPFTAGVPHGYQFLGFMSAVIQAAAAFQGIEISAIAASETVSPRRNVARAMKRVFVRICVFYLAGIFVAGLIVPSNDPQLLQPPGNITHVNSTTEKSVNASPFVIGMRNSGFGNPVVSIINAGVLSSAISAGNSFMFSASRILYGLALRGQAPACLAKLNTRTGTSIPAVLFTSAFGFLAFLNFKNETFQWFYNMAAVGQLITWSVINFTYLRFYKGMAVQQWPRTDLEYWNRFQPWLALWGLVWCIVFIIFGGYPIFLGFYSVDQPFIISYVIPSVFLIGFIGWRHSHKTRMISPIQMDFESNIPKDTETPEVVPNGFWAKLAYRVI
ncbi:general APC amino acid permease [Pisolithus croceorrhizus]|nr:general APC amino acid permease [Pisolithus croceorrhizus]KAI6130184.1 general APC amino acid permease [Pisolithus croceorrhizus]